MVATKRPINVDFPVDYNWTAGLIGKWIEREYGVSYPLAKADPEKQEAFRETFAGIKKLLNGEIDHVLFQDEAMIRDYQAGSSTWFLRDKQRLVPTYGKHQGVKLIGVLNYETGNVFCIERERYNAQTFLSFLKLVLEQYPTGKIIMVPDNVRIHHAKLIQPFLEEQAERLSLVFLPPYSPNLNLIEGLWKWLKKSIIENVFYSSVKEIRTHVQAFIQYINQDVGRVVNRLYTKM